MVRGGMTLTSLLAKSKRRRHREVPVEGPQYCPAYSSQTYRAAVVPAIRDEWAARPSPVDEILYLPTCF